MTAVISYKAHPMQNDFKKPSKPKTKSGAPAKVTSQLIAEQTRAFLKAGGKIIKVRSGVRDEINREKE
jgi:hypothetical protein